MRLLVFIVFFVSLILTTNTNCNNSNALEKTTRTSATQTAQKTFVEGYSVSKLFTVETSTIEETTADSKNIAVSIGNSWHTPKIGNIYTTVQPQGQTTYELQDYGTAVNTSGWLGGVLNHMKVSSPFGNRCLAGDAYGCFHMGTDFNANCGDRVYAAQSGEVIYSNYGGLSGNSIKIDHGIHDGADFVTWYMHLTQRVAQTGQHVSKGDLIGYVGQTGNAFGCHLHLTVELGGSGHYVDPMKYYS